MKTTPSSSDALKRACRLVADTRCGGNESLAVSRLLAAIKRHHKKQASRK